MILKQIFLIFRTLLSVVAMVLSLCRRFPFLALLLIAGIALTFYLAC